MRLRLLFILLTFCVTLRGAEPKPNIVLILADDLGINDLSCYSRKDQQTPNLDALAAQGLRFTSAYCAQPICSPSRAALMTGKCPARLHLTNFLPGRADAPSQKLLQPVIEGQLPREETTVADLLRQAGYATACIGKWHLGGTGFGPQDHGFDFAFAGKAVTAPGANEGSKGELELTAVAEQWMETNKERPFFLYLAHNSPHIPFAATPGEVEQNKAAFNPAYAAVIARLDECVGRVMRKLDALALAERTVLVFASDNGGLHVLEAPGTPATHNTPFRAGKGFVYEGGLRIPLIVRRPGSVKPGVTDAPVVLTDLMPTFLEIAGVDAAHTVGPLDGESLARLLAGGELPPRALFWHFPNYTNQGGRPAGAVREGEWKFVENYEDGGTELYHLVEDPGETLNLAEQQPERTTALRAKLAAWRKSVGAQECVANPQFDAAMHAKLYSDHDVSKLTAGATAAEMEPPWKGWREGMNAAVQVREVRVTPPAGDIRLHAKDATIHGTQARYESESYKNVIGYWSQPEDWASWDFAVAKAGQYEVEVQQGCAGGGSEVAVEVAGQKLTFTVEDTGHFQQMIARTIGVVDLPPGKQTLAVKPRNKVGGAVMDLRRVVLRPL